MSFFGRMTANLPSKLKPDISKSPYEAGDNVVRVNLHDVLHLDGHFQRVQGLRVNDALCVVDEHTGDEHGEEGQLTVLSLIYFFRIEQSLGIKENKSSKNTVGLVLEKV